MARNGIPIHSEKLTIARELRGLSISDLAKKIEKTRQLISMIENGAAMPSHEVLQLIASKLDFPIRFFTKEQVSTETLNSTVFFRSMKGALASQRQKSKRWLQLIIQQYAFYDKDVEFPDVELYRYEGNYEELTNQDIEEMAKEARKLWGLADGPISNLTLLLENHGIIVSHMDLAVSELDACSTTWGGRPFMLINTTKSTCSRVLSNTAHELGHLILHGGVDRTDLENKEKHDLLEKQAWSFAAYFLMPSSSFFAELHTINLTAFVSLKSRWRTSIASMIMRCAEEGIIDEFRKTYLFREMSRNGYRRKEPFDDTLPIEKPHLLFDADKALVEGNVFSKEELLDRVALESGDYCVMIGADSDYMQSECKKPVLYVI
jgi:Predicted Zn peptidase